jgi:beta-fructofuranosidase
VLDYGQNFYAPNTMLVPDGRRLVWGWVNGFARGRGWNGCLTLPRLLSFSRDGQLRQIPAPQLAKLRGPVATWRNVSLDSSGKSHPLPETNTFEIETEIDLQSAASISVGIKSGNAAPQVLANFNGLELQVLNAKAPLTLVKGDRKLALRIFVDRSVLEIFANETVCVTKVISPPGAGAVLEMRAEGGAATAKLIRAWPIATIW